MTDKVYTIPKFEGRYSISKGGRVWSHLTRRWLRASLSRGYPVVNLTIEGTRQKVYKVHRLMYYVFMSDKTGVVNHIDGNKENNCLSNLEVVSSSENNSHAYRIGLKKPVVMDRDKNPTSKLSSGEFKEVMKIVLHGLPTDKVADLYGITRSHLTKLFKDYFGFGASRKMTIEGRRDHNLQRLT
jgi:hypothetical protein